MEEGGGGGSQWVVDGAAGIKMVALGEVYGLFDPTLDFIGRQSRD